MDRRFILLLWLWPGIAFADGNRISLLQVAPLTAGNSLFSDQGAAQDSLVHGLSPGLDANPALQVGQLNAAHITQSGSRSEVRLSQMGSAGIDAEGLRNHATILTPGADQLAILDQRGTDNVGRVLLGRGSSLSGELYQSGEALRGEVLVQGHGSRGVLVQAGTGIDGALHVNGAGADVSYTMIGRGMAGSVPATVMTNIGGGQITIRQTR
ncbi:hypothetical protein [Sagittula sp. S175]|uniref:hypothetical protein n=1 Tax=Sagittula sp. S175 TaxID=3415129 RepID=UPI003C7AE67C